MFATLLEEVVKPMNKPTKNNFALNISSNDKHRISITQVRLKEENYDELAWSMRTTLRARKKFDFFNGTIKRPKEKSLNLEDWWIITHCWCHGSDTLSNPFSMSKY